jgi:hypothetical protein
MKNPPAPLYKGGIKKRRVGMDSYLIKDFFWTGFTGFLVFV